MTLQERLVPGRYRLTVEDYARLEESGAFGDARTELIDGEIVVMAPEYRPHAFVRDALYYRMRQALDALGSGLHAASGSIRISDHDMPQPDIVLTSEPRGEGPIPLRSIALLVEVSSTSFDRDSGEKVARYAAAGIPEYWIADINTRTVHQMWAPEGTKYTQCRQCAFGERIISVFVPDLAIDTVF